MNAKLKIEGMHCASCKNLIEDVARDVTGVTACRVDASTGLAEIEVDSPEALQELVKELTALGEYRITQI